MRRRTRNEVREATLVLLTLRNAKQYITDNYTDGYGDDYSQGVIGRCAEAYVDTLSPTVAKYTLRRIATAPSARYFGGLGYLSSDHWRVAPSRRRACLIERGIHGEEKPR